MNNHYLKEFVPYAVSAFLVGLVGGFASVLGPAFVSEIGIDYTNTTYTALATAMSSASFAPVAGRLCDYLGEKKVLVAGIVIFTIGNILSATADSLISMLPARFISGIGMASVSPVVVSYIASSFPQDKVSKGFSLYMFISSVAVIFGPGLGGIIVSSFGRKIMMWICSALCAVTLVFVVLYFNKSIFEEPYRKVENFDIGGCIFVIIFFSSFLCVPTLGQNFGWGSTAFIISILISAVSLGLLVYFERKAVSPVLSLEFMMRRNFILTVIALFLTQGLMQANMTNMILFVRYTQPDNTVISGYAISVMYVGMAVGSLVTGMISEKYKAVNVITSSLFVTVLSCILFFTFTVDTPFYLMALSLGLLGTGLGGNGTMFMKLVLSDVDESLAGAGSGTYSLFRDLSAPFGVAVFVPMFANKVSELISQGIPEVYGAVEAIKLLGVMEILCVIAAVLIIRFIKTGKSVA